MSVNIRLKEILKIKNLKIKDFSEMTGLVYRTAQNYVSGERKPDTEGLFKISTHLGVNLNWLIAGIGEPFIADEQLGTRYAARFSSLQVNTLQEPKAAYGRKAEEEKVALSDEDLELLKLFNEAADKDREMILYMARRAEKKPEDSEVHKAG
ncbi:MULTISPECIES: helix-turn-helix domain-containing protein [Neisseriaceae]|nr:MULTISPECIES: helix-turn-helix transcriptional regulator [Neisseriaceae]STZ77499.1 DNA-binding protein [Bergeriella denitrificans]STZ83093.1 DNA-binding protein [Bergeriella denitrificans]VEE09146.1 DNA-binding protein [Neisseria animalis]